MRARLRRLLFCAAVLTVGPFIAESDIIMGRKNGMDHLRDAAVHYVEEPREADATDSRTE